MLAFSLPRLPGRTLCAPAAGVVLAALFTASPAMCGDASQVAGNAAELSHGKTDCAAAVASDASGAVASGADRAVVSVDDSRDASSLDVAEASQDASKREAMREAERAALLARAVSLEVLGRYLWTNNLSESRARQRAFEIKELASVLRGNAERRMEGAATEEERSAAKRRLEVVNGTSLILNDVADKISKTRGTRRKIRILALDLSRRAWTVVRKNDITVPEDQPVDPGRLFKENRIPPAPSEHAFLREPRKDYLTYNRGAPDTDYLERRFFERKPRSARPRPEADIYYKEGALTLSPLDKSPRSRRIWWSPPAEELAWKVEQW